MVIRFFGVRIGIRISEPSNLNKRALKRGSSMRSEVVSGFAIGANINSLIIGRRGGRGGIGGREIGEAGTVVIGEEKVHAVKGATRTISLRPDLAGMGGAVTSTAIVGPTMVPLVALLDSQEGLAASMCGDVEVV